VARAPAHPRKQKRALVACARQDVAVVRHLHSKRNSGRFRGAITIQ
jgi:hypothetical protein